MVATAAAELCLTPGKKTWWGKRGRVSATNLRGVLARIEREILKEAIELMTIE